MKLKYLISLLLITLSLYSYSQEYKDDTDMGAPIVNRFVTKAAMSPDKNGDLIPHLTLRTLYCYPKMKFKNKRQMEKYTRLVRNVKKTLPLAKMINSIIVETYEYMMTLPSEKERKNHIKLVEKGIKKQYTPQMKKLSLTQGKLLIKLVDRECNQRSYDIIKAFAGSFKAGFYNAFASLFGASLKKTYDPEKDEEDKMIERICLLVESGQL